MNKSGNPKNAKEKDGRKKSTNPGKGQKQLAGTKAEVDIGTLRKRAEAALKKQAEHLDELSRQDIKQLVHELGTYQIELEMQNEDLRRTQTELEQSRSRLADLYDYAPVGYFTLGRDGVIKSLNLTATVLLGWNRKEMLGKPLSLYLHRDDKDLFYLCLQKTIQGESRQFCDLRLQRQDSTLIHAHFETMGVMNDAGRIGEIRVTVSDITERVKAEAELQEKTSQLRAIIDNTDVFLAYLDREFNFLWVNTAYARTCGMKPQELAGKNHFDLFPNAENLAIFKKVRDHGEKVFFKDKPFTFPNQPARGVTYWDWSLVPVFDAGGRVASLVFSLRETTPYKKMELELAESEAQFRSIAETSMDIIFQTDRTGIINYVSPAVSSMGYRPADVQGRFFAVFVADEDLSQAEAAFKRVSNGSKIELLNLKLIRADGSLADCEINANPIHSKGAMVGMQGIVRDVTQRMEAVETMKQLARFPAENPSPVMRATSKGILLYANNASTSLLAFWGIEIGDLLPLDIRQPLVETFSSEVPRQIELTCREKILSLNLAPVADGSFVNIYGFDITDRKLAEQQISHRNAILDAINSIFLAEIHCRNDEEFGMKTLQIAEELTGSRFGFIGQVGPDNMLYDLAISDTGWDRCAMSDGKGHRSSRENFRIAGLYGRVLSSGRSLLTNNPTEHPASEGTPPGHPPLTAFIGTPLVNDNRVIGLMAMANRAGGYRQEDLEALESLAPVFVETLFKARTERALQESEARERFRTLQLKQMLDFAPLPIWIAHDAQCHSITGNLAAAELQGLPPDTNVSRTPEIGVETPLIRFFKNGRELSPEELPLQQAVMNDVKVEHIEIDLVMPNGRTSLMLGAATPLYDKDGRVTGGISAYMDITERKLLLAKLQKAKQDWERTFDSVPDLIAILDKNYTIRRVNQALAKKLGLPAVQIIGRKCYTCLCGNNEPSENCPHTVTMQDGREQLMELDQKMLGGSFLVTTTPLLDEHENLSGSIYVARDITKQKETEMTIKKLNRELVDSLNQLEFVNQSLVRSNEDLLHFSSVVSHDLQEPLRTVTSFVELLKRRYETELDDKAQTFMKHIVSGTSHMQRLLNDLLAFSRVGGDAMGQKPVAMENILRDVRGKLDRSIKENRAEITMDTLPVVVGDELQLFTLLQNLISNALKYRSEAPPRIHVAAKQSGNEWLFCVQDNGIGIDPKHAERIFLIFQRLHLRDKYEGTGIGLAICKKIVERHGGRIWVESAPGRGASFCFSLPRAKELEDE